MGRWVYSLQDHQTIEQVAGFEYKSCCYSIQLVQRRYLSIRPGTTTPGATGYLDCITIGTDGPKFGRKA